MQGRFPEDWHNCGCTVTFQLGSPAWIWLPGRPEPPVLGLHGSTVSGWLLWFSPTIRNALTKISPVHALEQSTYVDQWDYNLFVLFIVFFPVCCYDFLIIFIVYVTAGCKKDLPLGNNKDSLNIQWLLTIPENEALHLSRGKPKSDHALALKIQSIAVRCPCLSSASPAVQMGFSLLSEQQPWGPGSSVMWEAAAGTRARQEALGEDGRTERWTDRRAAGWTDGWMDACLDGWMDRQTGGRMDRQTGG